VRLLQCAGRHEAVAAMSTKLAISALLLLLGAACSRQPEVAAGAAGTDDGSPVTVVDSARLMAADAEPGNWLSHGRTYDEQRYSPLTEIDARNVAELALAWHFDVPTRRGMEATPIVVDGRMYVTGA